MAGYISDNVRPVTTQQIVAMKSEGRKIAMLTSYDYITAGIVDGAGVDIILVGDSASNVMAGNETTIPITLEQMIYHARSVVRATKHALVVCDMPFGTYQVNKDDALRNAVRIMQESGCDALKLEGGEEIAPTIKAMVDMGIPVMGHLGLTPQSVHKFGGYGVRARSEAEAEKLLNDAVCIEQAGCFGMVLEKIPAALAAEVTKKVSVPTIGIGAGAQVDGQVLVVDDMLGKNNGFAPKFLRRYADLHKIMTEAIENYANDVRSGAFPDESEQY